MEKLSENKKRIELAEKSAINILVELGLTTDDDAWSISKYKLTYSIYQYIKTLDLP